MIKKIVIVLFAILMLSQLFSLISGTPLLFSFTLSSSMKPTIGVGDLFMIIPKPLTHIGINDIILFNDPRYGPPTICHRVIGSVDGGYLTRGDNSPFSDQQGGMPPIRDEYIIGKVLSFQGKPILIPQLGLTFLKVQALVGAYKLPFSLSLFTLGIAFFVTGKEYEIKRRNRWKFKLRSRHVFISFLAFLIVSTTLLMVLKIDVIDVRYLASTMPTKGDSIMFGETSERSIIVNNSGLMPIYIYVKPLTGGLLVMGHNFQFLMPRESTEFQLQVEASQEIGWHSELAEVYLYIALLPESFVRFLALQNPYVPIFLIVLLICLPFIVAYLFMDEGNRIIRLKKSRSLRKVNVL